jgi:hypothetical protein
VFARKTSYTPQDELVLLPTPPLEYFRPRADEVHISVTFTWDIERGQQLAEAWKEYYPVVKIGGPAMNTSPDGFTPGMYVKHGVTFTSRGCNHQCPWCLVRQCEGKLQEIVDFAPGHIVQDNNLLQTSKQHQDRVFAMLRSQGRKVYLKGGLESTLIDDRVASELQTLNIGQIFLAADTKASLKPLEKALGKLKPLDRRQKMVYVLMAYGDETTDEAIERLEAVWQLGGLPFAQLYQPANEWIKYPREWLDLAREWSRPAIMFAKYGGG